MVWVGCGDYGSVWYATVVRGGYYLNSLPPQIEISQMGARTRKKSIKKLNKPRCAAWAVALSDIGKTLDSKGYEIKLYIGAEQLTIQFHFKEGCGTVVLQVDRLGWDGSPGGVRYRASYCIPIWFGLLHNAHGMMKSYCNPAGVIESSICPPTQRAYACVITYCNW